ncbi:Nucleotidyltransferase domain-containing protein [Halovenus aranensis]|uniref:Nucleotidyltransferase domain-containing protein n=1 Tax=Halovenus aranensis TaxID=890420 RepID=A0A1G8UZ31_9EURY|nr:DUF4037 domain-containing protein [Halovenus aranensis]SDJ59112.1 Nucleotidyltransferase domain-containing protein [Halovenus aranensis]
MSHRNRYRKIATSVADELAENASVDAILLVGSTTTGYADEYSDIDIEVLGGIDAGQRSVEGVHVEWTPVTRSELTEPLEEWTNDTLLYTYAQAELLYDTVGLGELLARYDNYPPEIRRKKLYAGWFYGSGNVFDAQKAESRGDTVVQRCAATRAVEQFAALAYVLDGNFPPYRKWRFRDLPLELPAIDRAHTGDTEALDTLATAVEERLRPHLSDERIEKPYLYQPEFDRIG